MRIDSTGRLFTTEARETLDNKVSLFKDGSVESFLFIEGNRMYIDKDGQLSCVFLEEEV